MADPVLSVNLLVALGMLFVAGIIAVVVIEATNE